MLLEILQHLLVTLQLTLNNTDCEVEVECIFEGSETILERTFTASDGCNESTCTVTYTWGGNNGVSN